MKTTTREEQLPRNGVVAHNSPAEVLAAYLDKSPVVQAVIRDLIKILKNGSLSAEEHQWAEKSLQEALFRYRMPRPEITERVVSSEERNALAGVQESHRRMEQQEQAFAGNLSRLLEERKVSQAELARRVGVGPSAISMMLSRGCRPQKRTLAKIAEALGVELQELWPS